MDFQESQNVPDGFSNGISVLISKDIFDLFSQYYQ